MITYGRGAGAVGSVVAADAHCIALSGGEDAGGSDFPLRWGAAVRGARGTVVL